MNDYSKKILKVPTVTFVREQDQGKQPVLDVRNLGIDFGGLTAVDSFNITIGPTEISGLIGPNGAGKTTIFNLLTGVYQPTRGSVLVNGIDIKGMPVYKVNKLGIARTFQNIRLFTDMTVLDNVKVGLHNSMKCSFFSSVLHLPGYFKAEKRANEKAMELLDFMGLAEHANEKAGSLPYGVQRRLEIVRALATNPSVILLDEPAAGMNPSETTELMHQIRRIRDTFHVAIFLIEHDMKGVSFEVGEGEIVALIGANGAGKSTILKTVSGLMHPRSGSIHFCDQDITHMEAYKLLRTGLAHVPEGRRIFQQMTVQENLEMGAYIKKDVSQKDLETVFTYFPRLKERRKQIAGTLSGGEQQMLAMSRALMSHPKLMMLDEPSMGLAPILVDQIFDIIKELHKAGTTILLVEQNARKALQIADRAYVLETGSITLSGTGAELASSDAVKKAYLGG